MAHAAETTGTCGVRPAGERRFTREYERRRGAAKELEDLPARRNDRALAERADEAREGRMEEAPAGRQLPRYARGRHRARGHQCTQCRKAPRHLRLLRL